jgi:inosine/xanthosine triphosphate pyrophosphatase family protein
MAESEKNRISHRGIALRKMVKFLENETLLD